MTDTITTLDRYLNGLAGMDLLVPDLAEKNLPAGMRSAILTSAAQLTADTMAYAGDLEKKSSDGRPFCGPPSYAVDTEAYTGERQTVDRYARELAARGLYLAQDRWRFLGLDPGHAAPGDLTDAVIEAASGYLLDRLARRALKVRYADATVRDLAYEALRACGRQPVPHDVENVLSLIPMTDPVDGDTVANAARRYVETNARR